MLSHCCKIPVENCYFSHPSLGRSWPHFEGMKGELTEMVAVSPGLCHQDLAPSVQLHVATNELLVALNLLFAQGHLEMNSDPSLLLFREDQSAPSHKVDRCCMAGAGTVAQCKGSERSGSHLHFVAIRAEGKHITELSCSCCSPQWQHTASLVS